MYCSFVNAAHRVMRVFSGLGDVGHALWSGCALVRRRRLCGCALVGRGEYMGIVWIASYPKSGNTWVRFLLANYIAGGVGSTADVERAVPGLGVAGEIEPLLATRSPLLIKTHFPWGGAHPHAAHTAGAIVVVRYPKDILLSNLNYHRLLLGTDEGFTDLTYAQAFIAAGGDPVWMEKKGYGTLEAHVRSWLDAPDAPPVCLVRYEDLVRDAAGELRRILAFLGLPLDEPRVAAAAGASTFERMRELEAVEKSRGQKSEVFPGVSPRAGWNRMFVSEARVGSTLERIGPGLDAAFERRFAPLLKRLGYESAPTRPSLPFAPTINRDGLSRSA